MFELLCRRSPLVLRAEVKRRADMGDVVCTGMRCETERRAHFCHGEVIVEHFAPNLPDSFGFGVIDEYAKEGAPQALPLTVASNLLLPCWLPGRSAALLSRASRHSFLPPFLRQILPCFLPCFGGIWQSILLPPEYFCVP